MLASSTRAYDRGMSHEWAGRFADGVRRPAAAVARLAAFGPFFALGVGPSSGEPLTGDRFERLVETKITETRARFGAGADVPRGQLRACASLLHVSLVSRLVSPALGCAAGGWVPDLRPANARFADAELGVRFGVASADFAAADPADGPIEAVREIEELVLPSVDLVTRAVAATVALPRRVVDSNVASAFGGAATVIAGADAALGGRTWGIVAGLLDGPLADGGTVCGTGPVRLRRSGCCLYYRLPGGALCGDCVLLRRPRAPEGLGAPDDPT